MMKTLSLHMQANNGVSTNMRIVFVADKFTMKCMPALFWTGATKTIRMFVETPLFACM
jgi:hypothetical protein